MQVTVGSAGRFHTFDLARQLERLACLHQLYTAYPKSHVDGLPKDMVRAFPWLMGPKMLVERWGWHRLGEWINPWVVETFDQWMSSHLEHCDIFHCLSSFGIKTHQVAKERFGALTICDHGSSHIGFQDRIMAEEFAIHGAPYRGINRRILEREIAEYAECDLIFVASKFAYRSFVEMGISESKLRRIPYGVDLSLFTPVEKRDEIFRVIYVGQQSLRKGVPYLLEALNPLKRLGVELWLIGSVLPEIKPFFVPYRGNFRYFGAIPRTKLFAYYSQASVFVLPSIEDGFGLVMAQAMACGVPVIATTNTGAEDLFSDGVEGFIVPIRDAAAIREKIVYLYQHPDARADMAQAAMRRVKSLNGWDVYGDQVVGTYQRALELRKEPIANPVR